MKYIITLIFLIPAIIIISEFIPPITMIVIFGCGVAVGIYIANIIDRHIDNNTK